MPTEQPGSIRAEVVDRLDPHSGAGGHAAFAGIVDEEAFQNEKYGEVLHAVEDRLSQIRFSLVSMMVSGIYFGLLVGLWLLELPPWDRILQWGVPVVLVTTYGIYSTHQSAKQLRHLSEARALLLLLVERRSPQEESS